MATVPGRHRPPSGWRCFVALPVPRGVARRLDLRLAKVRAESPAVRWLPAEQLHLTLAFIGAVSPDRVEPLAAALADVAAHAEPFTIELAGAGRFGGRGRQEVAWVGLGEGRSPCVALAEQVLATCRAVGVLPEPHEGVSDKGVRPHLTVARRSSSGLPAIIEAALAGSRLSWRVDALVLYRSHLGAPGVRYEALVRLPLARDLPSGHAGG